MSKQSKWSREKNDSGWLADYNKKVDASFKEARDKVGSKLDLPDDKDFCAGLASLDATSRPSNALGVLQNTAAMFEERVNELISTNQNFVTLVEQHLQNDPITLGDTWQDDFEQTARCIEAGFNFTKRRIAGVSRRGGEKVRLEEDKDSLRQLRFGVEEEPGEGAILGQKGMEETMGDLVKGARRIVRSLPEKEL